MMDDEFIVRLGEVRRLRQRRAEAAVARKKAELEEAEARRSAVAETVALHLRHAAEAEQATMQALLSQPASLADLYAIRGQSERIWREAVPLRNTEQEAEAEEIARLSELSAARGELHRCHKAIVKFDKWSNEVDTHRLRRQSLLTEVSDEETHGLAPRWPEL